MAIQDQESLRRDGYVEDTIASLLADVHISGKEEEDGSFLTFSEGLGAEYLGERPQTVQMRSAARNEQLPRANRKASISSFTDLPLELYSKIITEVVAILGLRKAVKLRRVCRIFHALITAELCFDYTHNPHGTVDAIFEPRVNVNRTVLQSRRIGDRFAGRLLLALIEYDPTQDILSPISRAIQALPNIPSQEIQHSILAATAPRIRWTKNRNENHMRKLALHAGPGIFGANLYERQQEQALQIVTQQSQTLLCVAIVADEISVVKKLFESGDVYSNSSNIYFGRPLMLAAKHRRVEIIKYLLRQDAEWLVKDDLWAKSASPIVILLDLHISGEIQLGSEPTIDAFDLLPHEVDLLMRESAIHGSAKIFSSLLRSYSKMIPNGKTQYLLKLAIQGKNFETFSWMLENGFTANEEHAQVNNESPLHLAAARGRYQMVSILLNYGADIDYIGFPTNCTALNTAARLGYEEVVEVLLDHYKTNGQIITFHGLKTYEPKMSHPHIMRLLLSRGLDLNEMPYDQPAGKTLTVGQWALGDAASQGNLGMVELLVEAGVLLNSDGHDNDPVVLAKKSGHLEVAKYLVQKGAEDKELWQSTLDAERWQTTKIALSAADLFKNIGRY